MWGIKFRKVLVALGVAALLTAGNASAYVTFFGQDLNGSASVPLAATPNATAASNAFLASLIGVGTENFEGFAAGTPGPLALSFAGAGTATLSGGNGVIVNQPAGTAGAGRYSVPGGTKFWEVAAGGGATFTVTFDNPGGIAAFGFWGVDIGDFGGTLSLTLADGSATVLNVPAAQGSDGNVLFFGFIGSAAELFTAVTFNSTVGTGDVFAFDSMTIGSREQVRIPEPGTLLLFGLAALGAVGARKLRRA